MNKTMIVNKAHSIISKTGFAFKKHSPEIFIVTGVIGTVVSAVMACKATTKANDILAKTEEDVNHVHEVLGNPDITREQYSEEDSKKDLAKIYFQTGLKFVKLYAPSVVLGGLSIASILTSHNILRKRNIALASAYTAIDQSYKTYRNRVVERFGEEVEKEIRYGIKAREIEETVTDPKTNKEKKVKGSIQVAEGDPSTCSPYARYFDEGSRYWEKNSEINLMFLRSAQDFFNRKLKADGYVFLNDVYDYLDIPKTKAGQVVGWIYDPENDKTDSYIDFNIYNISRMKSRDFVNGYEKNILLDFNVDGAIVDNFESFDKMH